MNKLEYQTFCINPSAPQKIVAEMLINKQDRTLLYGYTCERHTWHVYLKNGEIHTVIYAFEQKPEEVEINSNYSYVPDKRVYPEASDYEFCKILKDCGVKIPFTTFNEERPYSQYYGEVI